jgi:hypothetical protein
MKDATDIRLPGLKHAGSAWASCMSEQFIAFGGGMPET